MSDFMFFGMPTAIVALLVAVVVGLFLTSVIENYFPESILAPRLFGYTIFGAAIISMLVFIL